ncbi:Cilia- and flagella-associated protein 299 [Plasmodiophora brassicae]|uniref:Cilia- and flagella-associated protein 299 n=1 Tax=Plasmodiophora brassicae TaxID=37360 RepID=A0A0G4IR70_PLABS|nr:hypothetical protein PBRA_005801 [Plasmodiophora brassicae]SPQ98231.1 unnamed protein product [Plasmodiophora brassicae]
MVVKAFSSRQDLQDDGASSSVATDFSCYEDYLDDQIKEKDVFYLQDIKLARALVELGYRGRGDTLKRTEFQARKQQLEQSKLPVQKSGNMSLCCLGKDVSSFPLLKALAEREENIRNGKLTTIIFIRDYNSRGQEISGFIDYAERLKHEDFAPYFERKKRLLPRMSDLSFYNWDTQTSVSTPNSNFQVIADNPGGLLFKNNRDRKVISVDPKGYTGDNSSRVEISTSEYVQVVLYDHLTRRKS